MALTKGGVVLATYRQIQDDVRTHHGVTVKPCWIAHVKELNGQPLKGAPNRRSPVRQEPCPPMMRPVIEESMRRLGCLAGGQPEDKETREELQRDLAHTTSVYLQGEGIFPLWEAIYAVIVSGFLVAFFQTQSPVERIALSFIGAFFTLSWARLVGRCYLYAQARLVRMNRLSEMLGRTVHVGESEFRLFNLPEEQQHTLEARSSWWNKKGTWMIRMALPKQILVVWVALAAYAVYLTIREY